MLQHIHVNVNNIYELGAIYDCRLERMFKVSLEMMEPSQVNT